MEGALYKSLSFPNLTFVCLFYDSINIRYICKKLELWNKNIHSVAYFNQYEHFFNKNMQMHKIWLHNLNMILTTEPGRFLRNKTFLTDMTVHFLCGGGHELMHFLGMLSSFGTCIGRILHDLSTKQKSALHKVCYWGLYSTLKIDKNGSRMYSAFLLFYFSLHFSSPNF